MHGDFMVGGWLVEPDFNRISNDLGDVVILQPKLMRLLCCFAERAGRLVTKDELLSDIWCGLVVNENAAVRAVHLLRKNLDGRGQYRGGHIVTVSSKGYYLAVPVTRI